MMYEIGANGMQPIETETKNNLEIGTVLQLNGYSNPEYVIIQNLGLIESFRSSGSKYLVANTLTFSLSQKFAYELKRISEKKDNRIQMYIMEKVLSPSAVSELREKAEKIRTQKENKKRKESGERKILLEKGKELFKKYIPDEAKALIIAELHQNESDVQSDYFHHSVRDTVIIGWSKHTRDLFSEMRKYAGNIPETKHLEIAPIINGNGQTRTKENKSYWHPEDEHREKHSMGNGYYLKKGWTHSTGWAISKVIKYRDVWGGRDGYYIAMAKRCIF